MHTIEPYHRWHKYYHPAQDERSPYFGKEYNYELYTNAIYNYFIDPAWDYMGSETLYIKLLWMDYVEGIAVIEMIGEWNDALYNDIMHLKRNIIDHFNPMGINKYILLGENVLNFHGAEDDYYEEWYQDVEGGWIVAANFQPHVIEEMKKYNLDWYIHMGPYVAYPNWRTHKPQVFSQLMTQKIARLLPE